MFVMYITWKSNHNFILNILYDVFQCVFIASNPCRAWRYDSTCLEYFVEDECKSLLKRSELTEETETTDLKVWCLINTFSYCCHLAGISMIANIHG